MQDGVVDTTPTPDPTRDAATQQPRGDEPRADAGRGVAPEVEAPATVPAAQQRDVAAKQQDAKAKDAGKAPKRQTLARELRGSVIAGAIGLPLAQIGLTLLALPLGIWYLSTVIRSVVVVATNAFSGSGAAQDTNESFTGFDRVADGLSSVSIGIAIVGVVLLVGGIVASWLISRAHGVDRPLLVTAMAMPAGLVLSVVLSAIINALTGLMFDGSASVGQIVASAAGGIGISVVGTIVAAIVSGALVWLWVGRVFDVADTGSPVRARKRKP